MADRGGCQRVYKKIEQKQKREPKAHTFNHRATYTMTNPKPSPAFTLLVADHIQQKVARRLEHIVNNAPDLRAQMRYTDTAIEELREDVRAELLPIYALFAAHTRTAAHARTLFALSLQRIESQELNAIETGNDFDTTGEYDGFSDVTQYQHITQRETLKKGEHAPRQLFAETVELWYTSRRFDTIVPVKDGGCKIMKNARQYVIDRYYRNHFPTKSKPFNVVTLRTSAKIRKPRPVRITAEELPQVMPNYETAQHELKNWRPLRESVADWCDDWN